jgi:hypothetical protein
MFLMASRGEGGARWLLVETRGNGQAEGGGRTGYCGRRKEEGGRFTAEAGRRRADGLRRKVDGGVSELRMCSYLAGIIRGRRKNLCGVKRVVGVRFSEVALLCGCCVLGGEVGVEFRLLGADVGLIGLGRIGWARIGWGSASTCG